MNTDITKQNPTPNQSHQFSQPKLRQTASLLTASGAILGSSLIGAVPLFGFGITKMFSRPQNRSTQVSKADKGVLAVANRWIANNNYLIDHLLPHLDLRLHLPDDLSVTGKYILISNHQSWVDTTLTQYISQNRLPLTRFFAKSELLYIPIVGQAFYFLDFPMMKRYSPQAIAKNPSLKNRDVEEARRACAMLANKPFTLLNYLEGTRYTEKKHALQHSPYQGLLKPKAGGLALAIAALGDKVDGILDMTIVYPDGIPTYSDLWKGNLRRVGIDVRHIALPEDLKQRLLAGQYQTDEQTRADMYAWVDRIWQEKQTIMAIMTADFKTH